jgi:trigger factor
MAFVKTKVEELPESRVRLDVEVPEEDVAHAFEHAASDMAESLRLPGFRKGKAPVPVVVARVGREAVWQEALRGHLDSWFWSAAETSGIRPVASPEVEFDGLPDDGGTFRFSATVAVMPKPEVADWTTLEVPFAEAEVPAEAVDAELDRLRDTVAELAPVEDRAVREGDTTTSPRSAPTGLSTRSTTRCRAWSVARRRASTSRARRASSPSMSP